VELNLTVEADVRPTGELLLISPWGVFLFDAVADSAVVTEGCKLTGTGMIGAVFGMSKLCKREEPKVSALDRSTGELLPFPSGRRDFPFDVVENSTVVTEGFTLTGSGMIGAVFEVSML
jgi:hypothetical protein